MANKTYNDVQINVKFTKATDRAELDPSATHGEHLAISLGKIAKWYDSLVPTGGSSGKFLGWNSSGTAKWVDAPTSEDKNMSQTLKTDNVNRPLLMSIESTSNTTATVTTTGARNNSMYGNVSTGLIFCHGREISNVTVKTGSTAQSHITLNTLMTWLITSKQYIPSGKYCHVVLTTAWDYANSDILQASINGTNYEIQLAGVIIEFMGSATSYNAGTFRLLIHSSPTTSFTAATGYTKFPTATIAEYTCNGSSYSPVWKMMLNAHPTITVSADTTSSTTLSHGGTFTAITSVTRDSNGHTTKVNTATYTLPSDNNTTYTFATGDAVGQFKVKASTASSYTNYNVNGISAGTDSGTANLLAYYSTATKISSTPKIAYHEVNSTASTPVQRNILHLFGEGVGNDAPKLISGTVGIIGYGDGGPQINFNTASSDTVTGGQNGAIIFTDHDSAAAGVSWHFVSDQTDWNVISKRFHAKTSISIGTDKPPSTTYTFYVTGSSYYTGDIVIGTSGSSSNDTGDITWKYGNGNEKARIWFDDTYTAKQGPRFRLYKSDGTSLYSGYLPLADGTSASGTWGISITGTAASANKLNTNAGNTSRPVYFSGGIPIICDTPVSGKWWNGVPYVGSNGVLEIGKYIDFHATDATTADYTYRFETASGGLTATATGSYNVLTMVSPDYSQIRFQTTASGKAYTAGGIVVYPLTTSGMTMLIRSDGNTVVGGGESATTLYTNSYDDIDTVENETLYLASDSNEIHLITNAQAYSGIKVLKISDGQLVKSGGQWISARDTAPVYANKPNTQDGGYYPAWFAKTKSGGWSMGVLSAQDNLYITYTTDTDYTNNNNQNTYQIVYPTKSGTIALISDIPSVSGYLPLSGGTMTGVLNLWADQYDLTKTALNCHNSNITGVSSLIFGDLSDNAGEGIMFYRSATPSWDVLWAKNGLLYFSPNYPTDSDNLSMGIFATTSNTDAWSSIGVGLYSTERFQLKIIRTGAANTYPSWMGWAYSPAIAFGGGDTKGVVSVRYDAPGVMFIGGQNDSSHTKPNWNFGISGTSGTTYNLANMLTTSTKYAGSDTVGGVANSAYALKHKTVTVTTLDSQSGSFAFSGNSGSGEIWDGTDWVGLQIGDNLDKFQLTVNSGNLLYRQNDNGGTSSTGWTNWNTLSVVGHTHSYADSPSAGGAATWAYVPRVNKNANTALAGANKGIIEEYNSESTNIPSAHWYFVQSLQGGDTRYGSQLAIGMTVTGLYYRRYYVDGSSSTWSSWQPIGRFTATPTSGKVVITDGTTGGVKSTDYVTIANGGTGATTRLNALKNLTNENVGTSATYFLTITSSWGKGGYTSVADAKTVLGLGSAAYTSSTDYVANTQTGVINAINLLGEGTSDVNMADYFVSQYAGGGTTTTTYHRRAVCHLWNTFKAYITIATSGSGNAITSASIANDGDYGRKITFTKGSTFALASDLSGYLPTTTKYALSDAVGGPALSMKASKPSAVPIATLDTATIKAFYNVNYSYTGNMPGDNNAIAIIQLNRHQGDYDSQIGFSNNGNIYYRCANGSALTNSTPWVKLAFSSDSVPMETVTTDMSANTYFTKTAWVNWNKNAGTSTTNLPTANWGILLTKALPSVQVWIPDNASGIYFRRKADANTDPTAWWGLTGTAGNTYDLANISNTGFGYRTLTSSTINTTTGSFVFGGDALLGSVNDWAGIQVEGRNDRFQLLINGHLMVRQNDDATISAAGWTAWTSCLRPADVSGSGGITVTQNDVTIGSGSTAATYKGTITLSHTNSITAGTAKGDDSKTLTFGGTFKIPSITYDANGHITTWTTTTMTMPSNPNSDTKVNVTLATTSKAYLLGTTTTPTSTAQGVTSVADTGVYLTTTAGELCAKKFMVPVTGSSSGYWGYDKGSRKFPLICDNGTNLWIGSEATVASTHHKGETYISTGWEGTLPTSEGTLYGNKTIYISIPYYSVPSGGTTGTWGGNNYAVYHTGYAPESYLTWGDKDFTGSNGVIDTCLNDALAANRFELAKAAGITIDDSSNSGSSWTTAGDTASQKRSMFCSSVGRWRNVGNTSTAGMGTNASKYMTRVTLDSSTGSVYSVINKLMIHISTNGSTGCWMAVQIRSKTNADGGNDLWQTWNVSTKSWGTATTSNAGWAVAATHFALSGWSGWNVLNIAAFTLGNSNSAHYKQIRFIFGCASNPTPASGSGSYTGVQLHIIQGYGGFGWSVGSQLAANGHLYTYDSDENAYFPTDIYVGSNKVARSHFNLPTAIGQGSTAANTKTFFDTTAVPTTDVSVGYNSNGAEYGFLFSKGGSNSYGTVLRWGYGDTYIRMLRKQGGTWKSNDWEKISAGYADKAGSITTTTGTSTGERPVFYAYLGDNSQVVYNTNFQYEPNGGVLRVPKITLGSGTYKATIQANPSTSANRTIQLPDQDGELAVANIIYYNSTGSQNPTVSYAKGYKSYIITIYHGAFGECTGTITVSDMTSTTHCHFPISHIDDSQAGTIRIGAVDIKIEPASSGNSVTFTAYICAHHLGIAGNASTLTNMTTSGTAVIRKIIGFM